MSPTIDFDSIFRRYYADLCHFAGQYVSSVEDCHDLVSTAFEDVWRQRAHLHADTVRQYLYASVRNRCIDHLRRSSKHQSYVEYVTLMSSDIVDAPDHLETQERWDEVQRTLDGIKSPTRDILQACYVEQKKYREVAEQMGISIATVKKHMVRALRLLRAHKKE